MSQNVQQPLKLRLRPSDASRWLVCRAAPGLLAKEGDLSQDEGYKTEGVNAHAAAAALLTHEPMPAEVRAMPKADRNAMLHPVERYVEFVRDLCTADTTLLVENKVPVFYADRIGYVDAAVIHADSHKVHIIDYKHGRGVSVQALRNPQLVTYAFGLILELAPLYDFTDDTEVVLTIFQPRVVGEEAERTWHTTLHELRAMCQHMTEVAAAIQADPFNQPFAPSEKACQFCPVGAVCPHRAAWLLGEIDGDYHDPLDLFNDASFPPPLQPVPSLTPERLGALLNAAPAITAWIDKVREYALAVVLHNHVSIPGWKLVASRPRRRWVSEAQVREFLAENVDDPEDYTITKTCSPAQARDLFLSLGLRDILPELNMYAETPDGEPTIAPAADKRRAWEDTKAEDEFETL